MTTEVVDLTRMICAIGKIDAVEADEDFYEAGFSSVSALELLLELEAAYEVTISDDDFIVARTPRALHRVITQLKQRQTA